MNLVSENFAATLSMGKWEKESKDMGVNDPVRVLAKAYEIARSALEYRADHLVRRAAIERILKRQIMFGEDTITIAETLLQELKWARYVGDPKHESVLVADIGEILHKYQSVLHAFSDRQWLLGLISAEIEERLNPVSDYQKFTTFAYHLFKMRVKLPEIDNLDLMLFVAVDKVYSQSDDQQISYHIFKLIRNQTETGGNIAIKNLLEETYKYFHLAVNNPAVNRLAVFLRKQIGPLVLIRDMYFAVPEEFGKILLNEVSFKEAAQIVLKEQLQKMRSRLNRATWRSLVYVFLTKMLLVLIIELPLEKILHSGGNILTVFLNMSLPVIIMWLLSAGIKLPDKKEQEKLVDEAVRLIFADPEDVSEDQIMTTLKQKGSPLMLTVYYAFYGFLFLIIFAGLAYGLSLLRFSIISQVIFIFFLSLVTFFAFRIKQTAMVYNFRPKVRGGYNFTENLMLPIVTLGGLLSQGVSRMNFLVFVFDFVLESPFKLILHFLDRWFAFLSIKKDEVVG
jgi:hypothetical protein